MNHPYRSSVGLLAIVISVIILSGALHAVFQLGSLIQIAAADLILTLIGIFLLTRFGWWGKTGFTTGISLAQVPLFILPLAIALFSLVQGIRVTAPFTILAFAALTILIGFTEETWFRGLIFTTLLPTGTMRAVAIKFLPFCCTSPPECSRRCLGPGLYRGGHRRSIRDRDRHLPLSVYGPEVSGPWSGFTPSSISLRFYLRGDRDPGAVTGGPCLLGFYWFCFCRLWPVPAEGQLKTG